MTPTLMMYLGLFMVSVGIKALVDVARKDDVKAIDVVVTIGVCFTVVLYIIHYALSYQYLG